MKISIITACYNNEGTISDTLQSVVDQSYKNVEHLIIDGASKDSTLKIIDGFDHVSKVISEPDNGIYDALNKGLRTASGDVVGFLHSDDYFHNELVLEKIATAFDKNPEIDCVFGDAIFVNEDKKVVRYYSSKSWNPQKFQYGRMPAHTSFFVRKEIYDKHKFDEQYRIAADFEQLVRILYIDQSPYMYLPMVTTDMRVGGTSTSSFKSNIIINKEILAACRKNGIQTNFLKIYSKYIRKSFELLKRNAG